MSARKPKVGDVVEVLFLDHVEDHGKLLQCMVWGRLLAEDEEKLLVCSWHAKGKQNQKRWAIARALVEKVRVLDG